MKSTIDIIWQIEKIGTKKPAIWADELDQYDVELHGEDEFGNQYNGWGIVEQDGFGYHLIRVYDACPFIDPLEYKKL